VNRIRSRLANLDNVLTLAILGLGITYVYHDTALLGEITLLAKNAYLALVARIQRVNEATELLVRYFLFILTVLFVTFVFLFKHPMPRWLRCSVISYTFLLHTIYIIFRLGTLNCRDQLSTFASLLLIATELIHYLTMCCLYLQMGWAVNKSRQADICERLVNDGTYRPTVAIFVPTYDEPVSILRRTLIGCQAINYPHKTVYLLDDTNRSAMRLLASELDCKYISRGDNLHAKAGNLNNAFAFTNEDLITFFDCDNIPSTNFLSRLVGFFNDPTVAMVISSLHYYNAQEQTKDIGIEMLIAADHAKSLSNSQSGRDTFNALLCFGTSYIVRRQSLEKIGGIPTETLCEDWATSIKLQALGYKTHFLNEVLSSGVAAENLTEFVQQRLRWCQGTLQSLFASTNPLRIPGLNWIQRLVHFYGVLYYLMYPVTFVSFTIPLLYFFFGIVPIEANVAQFELFFLPYFVMHNMMYVCFARRLSSLISSQVGDFIMCFPLTAVVARTFIKPFGRRFRVTRKGLTSNTISFVPLIGLPMLFMFTLYLVAIVVGSSRTYWLGVGAPFVIYSLWCIYRIICFWTAFQATTNLPQKRRAVRFALPLTLCISSVEGVHLTRAIGTDISDIGLGMRTDFALLPHEVLITIPELSLQRVSAKIVRADAQNYYGLEFVNLTTAQCRKIIAFIYCRPGQWEDHSLPDGVAVRALLRMFFGR
jgi:cellulose synthase (UDP-forming)